MGFKIREPNLGLFRTLLILSLLFGLVIPENPDFEFADKSVADSLKDDEDFLRDYAGSGDVSGEGPLVPSGKPEQFRVTINFSELEYTAEMSAAGRNIQNLPIVIQIRTSIENLLRSLPGSIRIRIVELRPGSLLVTFDVDTDGQASEEEIRKLLTDALNRGQLPPFRISTDSFEFRSIREDQYCPPEVGRTPQNLPGRGINLANLMTNNAFPCDGYITSWRYYRTKPFGVAYIGVWRQHSDTEYVLVSQTELPVTNVGLVTVPLAQPILVRSGDFLGVLYPRTTEESVIAEAAYDDNAVPDKELYQTYRMSLYDGDVTVGTPFGLSDFDYSELRATLGIQAVMDYTNVPGGPIVTTAAPIPCSAGEFTCRNGDCVDGRYRCDGQYDCFDGSDEDACPEIRCPPGEFQCANKRQCVPVEFRCNSVPECDDSSDELNCVVNGHSCGPNKWRCLDGTCISESLRCDSRADCPDAFDELNCLSVPCPPGEFRCERGHCINESLRCNGIYDCPDTTDELDCPNNLRRPAPVFMQSFRDGSEPTTYLIVWNFAADQAISRFIIRYRLVDVESVRDAEGNYIFRQALESDYREVSNIQPAGDFVNQYQLTGLRPDSYYQTEVIGENSAGQSEPTRFIFKTARAVAGCGREEFQCRSGECIRLTAQCDNFPDCQDASDEDSSICSPERVCNEGQEPCIDEDDNLLRCMSRFEFQANGCRCTAGQFRCADRRQCVSAGAQCNDVQNCKDGSDELNCGCRSDQFQCNDRSCVPLNFKCDGIPQCEDRSDEIGCPPPQCPSGDFQCTNPDQLECVDIRLKCDGVEDCRDGSDERNCPCTDAQFTCADGNCVEARMRCDGVPQCEDSSDEIGCPRDRCPEGNYRCANRDRLECIDERLRCDGFPDCSDSSDERGCPCTDSQFTCNDGNCVELRMRCDRIAQCEDGSDEFNCPFSCGREEFRCRSVDECIPTGFRCDGSFDCSDRSDEYNCTCNENQFRCGDGLCIDIRRRCDRSVDCADRSDELACPCRSGEFQCRNGDCISQARRCDGRSDCSDGTDESGCRPRCRSNEFQCRSGECIDARLRCNRVRNCRDASDESNCPTRRPCPDGYFQCGTGHCLGVARVCDGRSDCPDGSDEQEGCSTTPAPTPPQPIVVSVSPRNLQIREGVEAVFQCVGIGLPQSAVLRWSRGNAGLPLQSSEVRGELRIPVARVADSGDYVCTAVGVGVPGTYRATARLTVVGVGPQPNDTDRPCGRDEAVCRNGQCIRREYRCDGEQDCRDGSDELDCSSNNFCEPNEFQCPSGQCVMKIWRCDGENDCADGFDERNCQPKRPNDPCGTDEFQCVSADQCIPLAYQCDKEIDCQDRSDEIGCAAPVITVPPVAQIEVEIGGTFTIICEAVGVPTPLIVWRLNWGNIPTGERVTTISEAGRGSLTIRDTRYEDAGAYTCEAINNRGSIFAIPDAIVIVRLDIVIEGSSPRRNVIHRNKIIRIGGTSDVRINQEQHYIEFGAGPFCDRNLEIVSSGNTIYSGCGRRSRRIEIEYVGSSAVDIEVTRRVVLIGGPEDISHFRRQDSFIVYIGGYPEPIRRRASKTEIIHGVGPRNTAMASRILEIGHWTGPIHPRHKQIILIGVGGRCTRWINLVTEGETRNIIVCGERPRPSVFHRNKIIQISGSSDIYINEGEKFVEVGSGRPCEREVAIVAGGNRLYTQCGTRREKVQLEYIGSADIDVEVTKSVVLIGSSEDITSFRGQDSVVIYVGGLPENIKERVTRVEVIRGVGPTNDRRDWKQLLLEGSGEAPRQGYKQITFVGIGGKCEGHLQLVKEADGQSVIVCGNRETTEVLIGGKQPKIHTEKEIVIHGKTEVEETNPNVTIVHVGEPKLLVEELLRFGGSREIFLHNEKRLVEIGTGTRCSRNYEIVAGGSELFPRCGQKFFEIEYLGSTPSDFEVSKEFILIGGNEDYTSFKNQDSIMVYIGGFPGEIKQKVLRKEIIQGVQAGERTQERKIITLGGQGNLRRNYKQVLLIGLKRRCEGMLKLVTGRSGRSVLQCLYSDVIESGGGGIHFGSNRKVVVEGEGTIKQQEKEVKVIVGRPGERVTQSPDVHVIIGGPVVEQSNIDQIFRIGGTADVKVMGKSVHFGSRESCNRNLKVSYTGGQLDVSCPTTRRRVNIEYIGYSPNDVEVAKRIISFGSGRRVPRYDQIVIHVGGLPENVRKDVLWREVIGSVGSTQGNDTRIIEVGSSASDKEKDSVQVIEVGVSRICQGRVEVVRQGHDYIVQCHRSQTPSVEVIGRAETRTESEVNITVEGGGTVEDNKSQVIFHGGRRGVSEIEVETTHILTGTEKEKQPVVIHGGGRGTTSTERVIIPSMETTQTVMTQVVTTEPVVRRHSQYERIFQIIGGSEFEVDDTNTLVVLRSGGRCNQNVQLLSHGRLLNVSCGDGRYVELKYIGSGSTNYEITKKVVLVRGDSGPATEDSVMIYFGGLPTEDRNNYVAVDIIEGVGSLENEQKQRLVYVDRDLHVSQNSRQIVLLGVTRQCPGIVKVVKEGRWSYIECARKGGEPVQRFGGPTAPKITTPKIPTTPKGTTPGIVVGLVRDLYEKVFDIVGSADVHVEQEKQVVVSSGGLCDRSIQLMSSGQELDILCGPRKVMEIIYVGSSSVNFEVTKQTIMIMGEAKSTEKQDTVIIHFGGLPEKTREMGNTVEVIEGVGPGLREREVIRVGEGQDWLGNNTRQVVLVGVSRDCPGHLKVVQEGERHFVECVERKEELVGTIGIIGRKPVMTDQTEVIFEGGPVKEMKNRTVISIEGRQPLPENEVEGIEVLGGMTSVQFNRTDKDIILVGGSKDISVNQTSQAVEVEFAGKCAGSFEVVFEKGTLEIKCKKSGEMIDLTYIGNTTVDLEIAEHVEMVDTIEMIREKFDHRDLVTVHVGGLKDVMEGEILEVIKEVGVMKRGTNAGKQVIEFGSGSSGGNTRQVIEVGVTQRCDHLLELVPVGDKTVVQCLEIDGTVKLSVTEKQPIIVEEETAVLIGGTEITNQNESFVRRNETTVFIGQGGVINETKPSVDYITLTGTQQEITPNVTVTKNGTDEHFEFKRKSNVTKIFQIVGTQVVIANETGQRIDIGLPHQCTEDYITRYKDAALFAHCRNSNESIGIRYVGSEFTDLEIKTEVKLVPTSSVQAKFHGRDILVIYLGGFPQIIRDGKGVEVIKSVGPGMTAIDERIVDVKGYFGQEKTRNVTRILEIGFGEACPGVLEVVEEGGYVVVQCNKTGGLKGPVLTPGRGTGNIVSEFDFVGSGDKIGNVEVKFFNIKGQKVQINDTGHRTREVDMVHSEINRTAHSIGVHVVEGIDPKIDNTEVDRTDTRKTISIGGSEDSCVGKVEIMEKDGKVAVKCTIGGESVEINLIGVMEPGQKGNQVHRGDISIEEIDIDGVTSRGGAGNEGPSRGGESTNLEYEGLTGRKEDVAGSTDSFSNIHLVGRKSVGHIDEGPGVVLVGMSEQDGNEGNKGVTERINLGGVAGEIEGSGENRRKGMRKIDMTMGVVDRNGVPAVGGGYPTDRNMSVDFVGGNDTDEPPRRGDLEISEYFQRDDPMVYKNGHSGRKRHMIDLGGLRNVEEVVGLSESVDDKVIDVVIGFVPTVSKVMIPGSRARMGTVTVSKNGIVAGAKGPCNPPLFNNLAVSAEECVRCFCFGQSLQCFSSDLQVSRIALAGQIQLINRDTDTTVEQAYVEFLPNTREYQVEDIFRVLPQGSYYWSLPREFLGERLKSYGGELKYTIFYEIDGRVTRQTVMPDVIIEGNGISLYYKGRTIPSAGAPTSLSVPLIPESYRSAIRSEWERSEGPRRGDTPVAEYASREDLMMVLQNVTRILIRGIYDNTQTVSRIGGVLMTTAVDYPTEFGQAYLVEECTCPTGYTGLSCQQCATGFYRVRRGQYLGECAACSCNGHSNDCDPVTGQCLNCLHNTYGSRCELCREGYYGDATLGNADACQECPCPLTIPSNQFSRSCFLDSDRAVTCRNCPVGYEGRRCERCAEGYVGDPTTPGSSCTRVQIEDYCDPRGAVSTRPDPITGRCNCKENTIGDRCDRCKANSFYLTDAYAYGCVNCFCMGVSTTCQSTSWNRAQIGVSFTGDSQGVRLTDADNIPVDDQSMSVDAVDRELVYRNFPSLPDVAYYWSLPSRFLGDKVTSYGGSLRFEVRYRSRFTGGAIDTAVPLVSISGNDITFVYRTNTQFRQNQRTPFSVVFYEQNWVRTNGEPATREHMLMVLADLKSILIRATYEDQQQEAGLRDVTLDVAEDRFTGQDRGLSCRTVCLSCRLQRTILTVTTATLDQVVVCTWDYVNLVSVMDTPATVIQKQGSAGNCLHNTAGEHCESCAVGYYGDASRGTRNDCQKCPCPLTEQPNQFSPTCILDRDGQVTCTACPAGHTGRRCETCLPGYTGNPLRPGDYCKESEPDRCDCDSRGTVPNTRCDSETNQCRCKPYVQGLRCERCQDGYFYLDRSNPQGCLECFCSGITDQCSSSNYYRETIRPQLNSDGSHNFVLLNRRMSNEQREGFSVDTARNQVTFTFFEGVQQERESLFFQLPPKFRGDQVTSYGGTLRFTLDFTADQTQGRPYRDVDLEIISNNQQLRLYHLLNPSPQEGRSQTYEILLREESFRDLRSNSAPTRETFMTILSNIEGILIRATHHENMKTVSLRDVSMDIAVPSATALGPAPMVENCRCPEGYTGLSCEKCAPGYLRSADGSSGLGRCTRCNCNGHSTSCDPETGRCLNCQHNTEGDRCERCVAGYYGDPTSGTPTDCRVCPCPLTNPGNQFSRTCFLDQDNRVTCDRCAAGYTGRDCGTCAQGYSGNPREVGGSCRTSGDRPEVTVNPIRLDEPAGSTVVFRCVVGGQGPFNVVWSRLDSRPLPDRATVSPRYDLTIRNLVRDDTGRYVCSATNAYGVTRGTVELTVQSGPSPIRVQIDTTRVEVQGGRTARFVCTVVGQPRDITYILSWSKQGAAMPAKAVDQNGVLIIPNVNPSDAGNYVCTGSDMRSTDEKMATLIVIAGEEGPTVRIEPRYQTVDEGQSVRFECIATGSPAPTIEWNRGNRAMSPNAIITPDGVFRIPSVRKSDESDYYCRATNDAGTTEVRTILYVNEGARPERPTVVVRQTKVVALIGTTVNLECYVEDPRGRVTLFWSRQGGLPAGSDQDNGVLTLTNVQPSYSGNYVCTGTTDTGVTNTAITRLDIEVGPANEIPTARVEPERLTIPMGTTGTLRCIVTGNPAPTITWLRSRDPLAENHKVNGEVLRITEAMMEDRGIYVCRAENVAGVDQDWAVVEVERRMRPKIELYPDGVQTIQVGGSALFQCRVMDGDPPPTITWARTGNEPLTSRTDTMENGVIMFKQATQEEQGSYICTATNDMGTITATATLLVEGPPTIRIVPSRTIYAIIGQQVRMECIADGEPTPNVYWIDPSQPRRGDIQPEELPLGFPTGDGTAILQIESVNRENQGTYTCVAENTGGRSTDRVQLVVSEGGTAGVRIRGPGTLAVFEGQSVELTCEAQELSNPSLRWRRRNANLPPGTSVRNGVLTIPQFRAEYAGEYLCSAQTPQGNFEATVIIIVSVAPRLTISPQRISARAGEPVYLRCSATGTGPFDIEWTKVDGNLNPRAVEREGVLEINQITRADAGQYRCTVTNQAGTNEGYAIVEVAVPPSVVVPQRDISTQENRVVELRCEVSGTPTPQVRWEKDGGELPRQHRIQNGILTIYNVQREDAGRYICSAISESGSARDYAYLRVETGPDINGGSGNVDTQIVDVGDRVEMDCIVTGTPLPTIRWSREDGPLPRDSIVNGGILIIPQAKVEDAGTYTCTAVNEAGSITSKVNLYIRAQPLISVPQNTMTASLGSSVSMTCDAHGFPSPEITWYRKDGDMPSEYTIVDGDLKIPRVRPEDRGTYYCSAQNQYGQSDLPVSLRVGALVPHFPQNPKSYITYPPLNDVYLEFDILLSLKPESTEGMVLYNGQFNDGGGDFVCFGLNEGYPEFRFDVGSGPAVIRGNRTLRLNEWHTVQLKRNRKEGTLVVDDQPPYTGVSPGRFQGLDLLENMYLGSVPDFQAVPKAASVSEGFVGSISEVKIKGINLDLGAEALEIVGIDQYNGCQQSPCQNRGSCIPANTRYGYECLCSQGYAGTNCEMTGERCYEGACGPEGRCYNLEGGQGFRCVCPLGKAGTGCQVDLNIVNPFFNKTSFISYPPAEGALFQLSVYMEFKPRTLDDGILLYNGIMKDGSGDFFSIVLRGGYLEFRFDTGSGPAVIRSRSPIRVNEWTRVTATRKNREGTLVVNDDDPVTARPTTYYRPYNSYLRYYARRRYRRGTSPGSTVGLNLKLPLYLGGYDPTISVSSQAGATQGFTGCIAELTVNGRTINLIEDAIESANVKDCGERRLCDREPCENGGQCEDLPGPDYRCLCPSTHQGRNCDVEINICVTNSPCQHNAPCSITDEGYRCDCPLGYAGVNCQLRVDLDTRFFLNGDGFIELDKDRLPHSNTQERETISMVITTTQSNGLIFWHGERSGQPLRGADYFSIGVRDGYLEFSYELGSGPALFTSRERVDDGQPHTIVISRLGRGGSLTVDSGDTITGESPGFLQMLNTKGNIFLGGVSFVEDMTGGKFRENFSGCIENIIIQGKGPLNLPQDAVLGYNITPCQN